MSNADPSIPLNLDERLKQWATTKQAQYVDAVNSHGSDRAAARALNLSEHSIRKALKGLRKKAALHGFAPEADMTRPVPDPYVLRGTSNLYGADGELKLSWVKTKLDETKAREAIEEWVSWLVEDARGLAAPIPKPEHPLDDLLTVYPMGDPHFGMHAWGKETGEDFDLKIAEDLTYAAIDRLVASAPASKEAVILELGDFFHADNNTGQTPRSHAQLDTDNRWARVMQVGLRAMVYVIKRALEKHEHVTVRIVRGQSRSAFFVCAGAGIGCVFQSGVRGSRLICLHAISGTSGSARFSSAARMETPARPTSSRRSWRRISHRTGAKPSSDITIMGIFITTR